MKVPLAVECGLFHLFPVWGEACLSQTELPLQFPIEIVRVVCVITCIWVDLFGPSFAHTNYRVC